VAKEKEIGRLKGQVQEKQATLKEMEDGIKAE
jgi:hypothetical protein